MNEHTNVLDIFYRICGFQPFQQWLDLAQAGIDEGPACNLSQLSHYLSRFQEDFAADQKLTRWHFQLRFWMQFIYPLFCRGEPEAEDQENPFPRGRIPFLTIHQAKGLEFPVVVLGSPYRCDRGPALVERLLGQIRRRRGEPLERMEEFDRMRLFYVALSRVQNLLVIPSYRGRGQCCSPPFKDLLPSLPLARDLAAKSVPKAEPAKAKLPQTYSYTGDFLFFNTCPRQFLIFRRLGFAPARVQTRFFGKLVHRTIEDLHQHLIAMRKRR